MKQLKCEVCGGNDLIKQDGVFVCQNCGSKYSVEEIKKMVIDGPIKVEGLSTADSILKRAYMYLEGEEWDNARVYCNRVLDINPECAEAYIGLLMADLQLKREDDIVRQEEDFSSNKNFEKAMLFSDENRREILNGYIEAAKKFREECVKYRYEKRQKIKVAANLIRCGWDFVVGVNENGTVVIADDNANSKFDVSDWDNIIAIEVSGHTIVGLKSDGTVVATGDNLYGRCNVSNWENIISVVAGDLHIVGLKSDGTVVATGSNQYGQCDVSNWENIISIVAGDYHTVGLKSDGTVVTTCDNYRLLFDVSDWRDIIAVFAGGKKSFGLKADGTVVVEGQGDYDDLSLASEWRDIIAIAAADKNCSIGLKSDGTVVTESGETFGKRRDEWSDIVAVSVCNYNIIGLKSDGAVVTSRPSGKPFDVSDWKLFESIDKLEEKVNDEHLNKLPDASATEENVETGGCYIATAVYGSYDCPQVWTLRRFRDNTLAETKIGRAFIRAYYAVSPTIVNWFGNTSWFKRIWKGILDKMVIKLQKNGCEDTPYKDRGWK